MSSADTDPSTASSLINLALFVWGAVIWWRFQFASSTAEYRRCRLPATHISLSEFVFKVIVLLVGAFVGAAIGSWFAGRVPGGLKADPARVTFIAGIGFDLGGLIALLIFRRTPAWVLPSNRSLPLEYLTGNAGMAPPPTPDTAPRIAEKDVFKAGLYTYLAATMAVVVVQQIWFFVLDKLHVEAPRQPVIDLLKGTHTTAILVMAGLLAVVVAPILEELVFRAGIFRFGKQVLPRWAAFMLSAVTFGLAHASVSACVPLVVFAYILALSYERTGRIAVTMIAHALFNLTSLVLLVAGLDS